MAGINQRKLKVFELFLNELYLLNYHNFDSFKYANLLPIINDKHSLFKHGNNNQRKGNAKKFI